MALQATRQKTLFKSKKYSEMRKIFIKKLTEEASKNKNLFHWENIFEKRKPYKQSLEE